MTATMRVSISTTTLVLLWVWSVFATASDATLMMETTNVSSSGKTTTIITFPLIPHSVQRTRRGLAREDDRNHDGQSTRTSTQKQSAKDDMVALYQGYGTHYVDVWCGTPPQRQTLIVDTGSGKTSFPCSECHDCGYPEHHTDPYFVETASSSFQAMTCNQCSRMSTCHRKSDRCVFGQSYSEGSSWKAYEAVDTCYIGGFHNQALLKDNGTNDPIDPGHAPGHSFDLRFGCQNIATKLFKTQLADGIVGMCDGKNAFWHQMYRAHKIQEKRFSLCFARPGHPTREGTQAGALTLGGTDTRLHTTPMVYTTVKGTSSEILKGKSGYFDIYIRKVYLRAGTGGESAVSTNPNAIVLELTNAEAINANGGVIVDSGTTDTFFHRLLQDTLEKNWKTLTKEALKHDKIRLTNKQLKELPTILIQMAGDVAMNEAIARKHGGAHLVPGLAATLDPDHPLDVVVAVPPSHYMENLADGMFQNRVYAREEDGTVLGANTILGHDVLLDSANKRVGWAESSCDYTQLVTKDNGYPNVLGDESSSAVETVDQQQQQQQQETQQQETQQQDEKQILEQEIVEDEIQEQIHEIDKIKTKSGDTVPSKAIEKSTQASATHQHEDNEHKDELGSADAPIMDKKEPPLGDENSHNLDVPMDDLRQQLTDSPALAGGGLLMVLLLSSTCCFCLYRCWCTSKNKKTYRGGSNIEMKETTTLYRDDFDDEHDDDGDDKEYGEYKDV